MVSLLLVSERGELLLGKRLYPPWTVGKWAVPFTQLKVGESPSEAAIRVVKEQLRTTCRGVNLRYIVSQLDHHWDIGFVYVADGLGKPATSEFISELQFWDPNRVEENSLFDFHRYILEDLGLRRRREPLSYRISVDRLR